MLAMMKRLTSCKRMKNDEDVYYEYLEHGDTLVLRMKHGISNHFGTQLVVNSPSAFIKVSFYMKPVPEILTVPSADLLAPEGYGEISAVLCVREDYDAFWLLR